MNRIWRSLIITVVLSMIPSVGFAKPADEAKEVRAIIDKVNNHWQKTNEPQKWSFWHVAAYHTGNMEAYKLTGNPEWLDYSLAWADHNQWMGAKVRTGVNGGMITVRPMTMCSSATGRYVSRHMPIFTIFFRMTNASSVRRR